MGLLHPDTPQGQRQAAWDQVRQTAQSVGLPLPPKIELPQLPDLTGGGCDAPALEATLGAAAAGALRAALSSPEFRSQVQGQLAQQRAQVLSHFEGLERQRQSLLSQLSSLADQESALGQTQQVLGQARDALGLNSAPIAADLLAGVAAACPAVGALLQFAEGGIAAADQALIGVASTAQSLTDKLSKITDLQASSQQLLDQIDEHINALPGLFAAAGGT